MKYLFIVVLAAMLGNVLNAQDQAQSEPVGPWKKGGTFGLNINQVSLTNWQAGGENSVSGNGLFNGYINYKKNKSSWENTLTLAYGLSQIGDNELRKTDDRIEFNSTYGYQAHKRLNYTGFLTFRTQFTDGFNYPNDSNRISTFMAPGYLIGGLGMDYKPSEGVSINFAPVSSKITIVNDQKLADAGAFGVEGATYDANGDLVSKGERMRAEFGASAKFVLKQELMENVSLQSQLDLFVNYLENMENVDVNWDMIINMKVNKWLSASLTTNLIYDDDIAISLEEDAEGNTIRSGPRTQFKQVFGAGINITF